MAITASDIREALLRWIEAMHVSASELNELDGKLGDGDLGVTLSKCATNVAETLPNMPDNIAGQFQACARACMEASGSSFGTLLAVGFLAAAKASKEKSSLELKDVAVIMKEVADAISTRGGANAGDKTFLDSILAVQSCLEDRSPQVDVRTAIRTAVASTILEYREKPNRIGRARMFGDRSIGMDDPGMVAFAHMVDCV